MRRTLAPLLSLVMLAAAPAFAQAPLADLVPDLFDRTVVLADFGHQAHFVDSSDALRDAGLQLNGAIVSQLTTYPLSSPGSSFTFTFDPEVGLFTRSTDSFGPIFAERPDTIGKGKLAFGVSFLSFAFDRIDGLDLRDGDLGFSLTHLDTNNDGTTVETFFEGDLVLAEAALDLSSDVTLFYANYGVNDRLDVAVAVPYVQVDLSASLETRILRQATEGYSDPPVHVFPDGSDQQTYRASGSASGLGDLLVRGKIRLLSTETAGLAAMVDLRLPTGDEDNLLGSGSTQIGPYLVGAVTFGRFTPHVNLGYVFSSGSSERVGELPDEVKFTFGFDWVLNDRVTASADLLWRTLIDARQLESVEVPFLFRKFDETTIRMSERPLLETRTGDINLTLLSAGVKVNPWRQLLVTANLLYSISDAGLQDDDLMPFLGVEYSF